MEVLSSALCHQPSSVCIPRVNTLKNQSDAFKSPLSLPVIFMKNPKFINMAFCFSYQKDRRKNNFSLLWSFSNYFLFVSKCAFHAVVSGQKIDQHRYALLSRASQTMHGILTAMVHTHQMLASLFARRPCEFFKRRNLDSDQFWIISAITMTVTQRPLNVYGTESRHYIIPHT